MSESKLRELSAGIPAKRISLWTKTVFVTALVCVLLIAACSNQKGQDFLNATVLELTETDILAVCTDGSSGLAAGDMIRVSKNVVSADGVPELEAGDHIRVVYDSGHADPAGDPVEVEQVYAIYLLDEDGRVIAH
ncbi:MAG: hypothetical protein IJB59_10620 [Oscillospiraceae bacterium]|nr:hypothetical protein [Oscillospiraceae bacterium]